MTTLQKFALTVGALTLATLCWLVVSTAGRVVSGYRRGSW